MSKPESGLLTVGAVVAEVERLHAEGHREIAADPYVKPFMPFRNRKTGGVSVSAVRFDISTRASRLQQEEAAKVPEADRQVYEFHRDIACRAAIAQMRERAADVRKGYEQDRETSERAVTRLARRHGKAGEEEARMLTKMTPGQRVDRALRLMETVSTVSSAPLEREAPASERDYIPPKITDEVSEARKEALNLALRLEAEVKGSRLRDLGKAA
jgi:hypothetical protein